MRGGEGGRGEGAGNPSAAGSGTESAEMRGERGESGEGGKKKQWKQIIPRHIRIKKLPAKTQNNHMVSVGSDGQRQQRFGREARKGLGHCTPGLPEGSRVPAAAMEGPTGYGRRAEPGLLSAMEAAGRTIAKQGAEAAWEEGEGRHRSACCHPWPPVPAGGWGRSMRDMAGWKRGVAAAAPRCPAGSQQSLSPQCVIQHLLPLPWHPRGWLVPHGPNARGRWEPCSSPSGYAGAAEIRSGRSLDQSSC